VSTPTRSRPDARFFLGFLLIALVVAGGLSYLADSDPDGLDTVTLHGCEEGAGGELAGTCIAQNAGEHALAGSPFADYAVAVGNGGGEGTVGIAGVLGVVVCLALAGGLFWALRRRTPGDPAPDVRSGDR
jgi:cobalt/nickel transport protein